LPKTARGSQAPAEFIETWIKENNVVLFMKGSPSNPQCGFSANASAVLKSYNVNIAHVDVIADPEVRQGIKDFSNWPTIPQVYIGGEFLGGSDILMQMHEAGELGEMIEAAGQSK
jgi:monothiol glutaredoxin